MLIAGFIIAQIVIFGVIILILKRLIFQDTSSAINRLTAMDDLNRSREKQLIEKLDETERLLKQRKQELLEEEERMKTEVRRAANELHDDIVKKAKAEAEEIIKKAQAAKDKVRAEIAIEVEARMIDFCTQILNRVISSVAAGALHERLMIEFYEGLASLNTDLISTAVQSVDVISAYPMSEEHQKALKDILEVKLKRSLKLVVTEDKNLIAGLTIKFGTLIVDDSMLERVKAASGTLKEELNWKLVG